MDVADFSGLSGRLADVLVKLVPGRPEVFDELRALYAHDLVFQDPIQIVRGLPDFIAMNERLLGRMKTLEWTILGAWDGEDSACLEWNMTGRPKLGPELSVDGMTRVRARDGKLVHHRDYWDLAELGTSALPQGNRLLRAVLKPFA